MNILPGLSPLGAFQHYLSMQKIKEGEYEKWEAKKNNNSGLQVAGPASVVAAWRWPPPLAPAPPLRYLAQSSAIPPL